MYEQTMAGGNILIVMLCICVGATVIQGAPQWSQCGCSISVLKKQTVKADCKESDGIHFKCLAQQPLEYLDLSRNELQTWPVELISLRWEKIVHLDLSFNNLTSLPRCIYSRMPRLEKVNLTYNHISEMYCDACQKPFIDLSHNPLDKQHFCNTCNEQSNLADCISNDSDQPKTVRSQGQWEINKNYWIGLFFFFLCVFVIGILCNNSNVSSEGCQLEKSVNNLHTGITQI